MTLPHRLKSMRSPSARVNTDDVAASMKMVRRSVIVINALFEQLLGDVTFSAWIDDLFVLLVLWHINPTKCPGATCVLFNAKATLENEISGAPQSPF